MVIIRILVGLVEAILKVFADVIVEVAALLAGYAVLAVVVFAILVAGAFGIAALVAKRKG